MTPEKKQKLHSKKCFRQLMEIEPYAKDDSFLDRLSKTQRRWLEKAIASKDSGCWFGWTIPLGKVYRTFQDWKNVQSS
ncbi:MAG: hypothetical protein GDA39_08885 [Hyphomonadaceae bacterium]|nr:hypothetical protein [Hyphomonadaceae bacterium]MBC6412963.1 hypothetical protein [Hyphomonadaceae bacterium]